MRNWPRTGEGGGGGLVMRSDRVPREEVERAESGPQVGEM